MTENKPRLRITAGVLLLIIAGAGLTASLYSRILAKTPSVILQSEWLNLLESVLIGAVWAVIPIFLLTRKFRAAGIAECVSAAVFAAYFCLLLRSRMRSSGITDGMYLVLLLSYLLFVARDIVLAVGFFRQSKLEKRFFLLGGILWFVAILLMLGGVMLTILTQLNASPLIWVVFAIAVLPAFAFCAVPMIAWLLMARWNAAQKDLVVWETAQKQASLAETQNP